MPPWTTQDIPSQAGRLAVVTGTGGLGFQDALALARAGAEVILAGRSAAKGQGAVAAIKAELPQAQLRFEALDLADLSSIDGFGQRLAGQADRLDLLINNAGVMVPPQRQLTRDGFELQFGTNHLGHFALTAHLMPLLRKGRDARVISLSSVAARSGVMDLTDLNATRDYRPMPVYARSKLACLIFALEFDRRSTVGEWGVASIASHPGVARTDLLHNGPGRGSFTARLRSALWFLFQPAAQGALPTLYAATDPGAQPGGYYGPDRLSETRGHPAPARIPPAALDRSVAARLWEVSEQMTGARFPL